jgi:coenzyme F420-reducing hydrogenase beta subunit
MNKLTQIVDGGYCIGCGACSYLSDHKIPTILDQFGQFQADLKKSDNYITTDVEEQILSVCPFSNNRLNEDVIAKDLYGDNCEKDTRVGYHLNTFAGYVAEDNFRDVGASGGFITWILAELLRLGLVDGVAHVKKVKDPEDGVLFRYGISRTVDEVKAGAKSRYYPIEMSEILQEIKDTPGRYVVVGLPCFIKAVRRLSAIDPVIKERVVYCVGLVCGHLKSKAFADCFGWQLGIPPEQLEEIDFRVKFPDRPAGDYGMFLKGAGKEVVLPKKGLLGANWGHNLFRYSACDYCDDVFAETADVVVGDAWLPRYVNDSLGNSVLVVRDQRIQDIISTGLKERRIEVSSLSLDEVARSQAGGLRDRREGLSYRLHLKTKEQKWAPEKRVKPERMPYFGQRARVYRSRIKLRVESHILWKEAVAIGSFKFFAHKIGILIKQNHKLYHPLPSRALNFLKRMIRKCVAKKGR